MSTKRRIRDFQRCLRNIKSFSDNQAMIDAWDEDLLSWAEVLIRPSGGYYEGGTFRFKIYFEYDFPKSPPRVDCLTPIYHPNIDTTCDNYNVCLNLFDEWDDRFSLEDIIQGLLFLLYNPNIEDPLSPYFSLNMSEKTLEQLILQSLQGGDLDGATEHFPENNTEEFDEEELTRGIELILEKASRMVVKEDEEEKETPNVDIHEVLSYAVIRELRLERTGLPVDTSCAPDTVSQINNCPCKQWTQYIPREFIPMQFDPLTDMLLLLIEVIMR